MRLGKSGSLLTASLLIFFVLSTGVFAGGRQEESQKREESDKSEQEAVQEAGETERQEAVQSGTPIGSDSGLENGGDSVATVNGVEISRQDFDQLLGFMRYQYMQQGMQIQGQQLEQLKQGVLESLIDDELIYQIAVQEGYEPGPREVDAELSRTKEQFGSEEEYRTALAQQGFDEEDLRHEIKKKLTRDTFEQDKFISQVEVSQEEVRKFYDENPEQFTEPFQFRSSHILVTLEEGAGEEEKRAAREKIEEVQRRLEAGEEFSELARQMSEGPSAENGGDLNYAPKGSFVPEFEEAALELEVGEVSDIVETQFGYHIIKLTDIKEEQKAPFEQIRDRIEEYLVRVEAQEIRKVYLAERKLEADINRNL